MGRCASPKEMDMGVSIGEWPPREYVKPKGWVTWLDGEKVGEGEYPPAGYFVNPADGKQRLVASNRDPVQRDVNSRIRGFVDHGLPL